MPKATTKIDLIKAANEQFNKLWKMIDDMNENEQNMAFCFNADSCGDEAHWKRDRNLRDVLIHLYEWHQLLLKWEKTNTNGNSKPFLQEPYTWKNYGDMNIEFWKNHQSTPLKEAIKMLKESHKEIITVIEKYTDEELFVKAFFKWTGTTSFGQYCISSTISHYDWAIKKLKAQIKALKI